jgi:hypothetical protein
MSPQPRAPGARSGDREAGDASPRLSSFGGGAGAGLDGREAPGTGERHGSRLAGAPEALERHGERTGGERLDGRAGERTSWSTGRAPGRRWSRGAGGRSAGRSIMRARLDPGGPQRGRADRGRLGGSRGTPRTGEREPPGRGARALDHGAERADGGAGEPGAREHGGAGGRAAAPARGTGARGAREHGRARLDLGGRGHGRRRFQCGAECRGDGGTQGEMERGAGTPRGSGLAREWKPLRVLPWTMRLPRGAQSAVSHHFGQSP